MNLDEQEAEAREILKRLSKLRRDRMWGGDPRNDSGCTRVEFAAQNNITEWVNEAKNCMDKALEDPWI